MLFNHLFGVYVTQFFMSNWLFFWLCLNGIWLCLNGIWEILVIIMLIIYIYNTWFILIMCNTWFILIYIIHDLFWYINTWFVLIYIIHGLFCYSKVRSYMCSWKIGSEYLDMCMYTWIRMYTWGSNVELFTSSWCFIFF